jgi:alkyl sulfatase BDS1-like metallo-beta-lactamase superfamily hydrolase
MAVRLKAEEVGGLRAVINLDITDLDEQWVVRLSNRSLHGGRGHAPDADATLRMTRSSLYALVEGNLALEDGSAIDAGGDLAAAGHVFGHLDVFLTNFGLAEP